MYPLTCHCNLQDGKIQDAVNHTLKWIPQIRDQYDEPKFYEAFTDLENPNILTYFMTFSDKEAEERIASMEKPRKFGEDLYKMCTQEPKWIEHELVNSIRNSKPDSQIHTRVEYKVKPDVVSDVKKQIVNYIDAVRDAEPDIRVYESYQNKEEPSKFTHLAEFKDKAAEQNHKDVSHTKKFAEFLWPLCEQEPKFIYMNMIGSARR
ncbi:putative quinol monooxygenase [Candidatus Nitrosopumilus sediminis]|uniref:Antibiotic biosynthesis monooxygenase n=1 Tax=Candidatus Nitrosopumilus sediminis TaxID=1229909 RepID=K0BE35_9ARCH|nr:antibiotic biosynthesis monooxygenase [Candidatus Nitrosopumilus sediminis]AFS82606.1 antibiotic biosynthesis monooxygenase [Candidatus Nitrosopumilus sediminis]